MTFVSLTNASLHDVEPEIAGAASGLVNVSQQLGAAVGLAVLVTAFNAMAGKAQLSAGGAGSAIVHPIDAIFGVAALFTLGSLATVLTGVRTPRVALEASGERPDERIGGSRTLSSRLSSYSRFVTGARRVGLQGEWSASSRHPRTSDPARGAQERNERLS